MAVHPDQEPKPDNPLQSDEQREIEKVLEALPDDQRELVAEFVRSYSVSYSGPLPPPSILRGFEEILPGAADRVFKMAEREQFHIQSIQNKLVDADISSRNAALNAVFLLAAVALVGGIVLIALGRDIAGFAFIATVLGAIGAVYWRRQVEKKKNPDETESKSEADQ